VIELKIKAQFVSVVSSELWLSRCIATLSFFQIFLKGKAGISASKSRFIQRLVSNPGQRPKRSTVCERTEPSQRYTETTRSVHLPSARGSVALRAQQEPATTQTPPSTHAPASGAP